MIERLALRLGASRLLVFALSGAHLLAGVGLWLAPLPLAWAVVGSLGLAGHLVLVLRRDAWRTAAASVVGLELRTDRSARACSPAGLWSDYRVAGSSFTSPVVAVVNLSAAGRGRGRTILIAKDDLDADTFRRLRVWLGWRYGRSSELEAGAGPRTVGGRPGSQ